MQILRCFLFVLSILLYYSCSRCRCIDNDIDINFINFDSAEVDTIIIKKYDKGTAFVRQIDSTLFKEGDYRIKRLGDTIYFPIRIGNFSLTHQFDYKIVLPRTSAEFKITEIASEQVRGSCVGDELCINPVISAKVNNELYYFTDYNNLYIKK